MANLTTPVTTFQTPSVVTPSPSSVSTNAKFSQIATPTTLLPSFTNTKVPVDTSKVAGIVAGTNENIVQQQQAEIAKSQEQQMFNAIDQKYRENLGLSGTPGINERAAVDQASLMQENDVTGKKAIVKSLLAQITANKVNGTIGGTVSMGGFTQGQYDSQIESKNLMLGAQLLVAQGQYDSAKEAVTDAITMKYAPEKARNEDLLKYAEFNKDALGKKADRIKELATARIKDDEKRQVQEKDVAKLIIDASPVAPPDVIARAKAIQANGGSAMEVAMSLGKFGGDYLKNEMLKEQLKTEVSQRSKIASDISVNNAQIRNYNANIEKIKTENNQINNPLGIPTKPLTEMQAKDLTYAQRGDQSGSYIDNLTKDITKMNGASYGANVALSKSVFTNSNADAKVKQYEQAKENFVTAVLRRESGASIADSEGQKAVRTYIPQPGDDTQTILQKAEARKTAIASIKANVPRYDARVAPQVVSTGNKAADDWFRKSSGALQNVNLQTSTPNAMNAGYVDNQK